MPDTITVLLGMLGIAVTLGAIILTALHRMEARMNRRMDAIETNAKKDIADSEVRTRAEIVAVEARLKEEIVASEARSNTKFEEINEQIWIAQARTDSGFADVNEQLRATNDRMTSIERQQARLGGLLDGLREALFQRVQQ